MRDLKNPILIHLKGWLFLLILIIAAVLLIVQAPCLRTTVLVILLVWSSARFYYYLFYVIERYVDSTFKFSGIFSALLYLAGGAKSPNSENSDVDDCSPTERFIRP